MMNEWDIQNARDEAVEEARQEGMEKGMEQMQTEIARKMLQEGLPLDLVEKITGLSSKEIANLQNK